MAKIVIAGEAVVVSSAYKLEDFQKIAKYRPEALVLYGGEDNKEQVFRVGVSAHGSGTVNKYGVEFSEVAHEPEKLATVTMIYTGDGDGDIKERVADEIGPAVMMLNKLEDTLGEVISEINAERTRIMNSITVAG